jgi:hypothetical protein
MKRAYVTVARKLAVIMHRLWLDGMEFNFGMRRATDTELECWLSIYKAYKASAEWTVVLANKPQPTAVAGPSLLKISGQLAPVPVEGGPARTRGEIDRE